MGRKIYIDIGANHGVTIREFLSKNLGYIVFAFEPTPCLFNDLRSHFAVSEVPIHIMDYAAWIFDGITDFYLGSASDMSSTLLTGKKTSKEWEVNYLAPTKVKTIDFARWFQENTSDHDSIILKMDIEGAEYKVLQRLVDANLVKRIQDLRVEWHWDRYPDQISMAEHDRIRNLVSSLTNLTDWR